MGGGGVGGEPSCWQLRSTRTLELLEIIIIPRERVEGTRPRYSLSLVRITPTPLPSGLPDSRTHVHTPWIFVIRKGSVLQRWV